MIVINLSLSGLKLIKPFLHVDNRGFFLESYNRDRYAEHGIDLSFVQDNLVYSKKGTLRGMHYQTDPGQDKLIYVSKGRIFDVAVDIRKSSSTFGSYETQILDETAQFFIPKGYAHGYLALTDEAIVHYKVSSIYDPQKEKGFRWDDPQVAIPWPMKPLLISERDKKAPSFSSLENSSL